MAGKRPKKMPTLAEKPMPMANDHQGREIGKPEIQWISEADPAAEQDPERPAEGREECRLDQELPQDLAAAGAECLANADLARPLRDRDHHDRHDADAADHQRDRRDDDQREEGRLADLVPHLHHRVLGQQVEVVRLLQLQIVADAHGLLDLAHRHRRGGRLREARPRSSPCGIRRRSWYCRRGSSGPFRRTFRASCTGSPRNRRRRYRSRPGSGACRRRR